MKKALQLQGLGVAFNGRTVLKNVHLTLPGVGFTVLLGPSGTGKSTLLRTLAGFNDNNPALQIWGEAHYWKGPCVTGNRPALVMQHSRLLISTVLENLVSALPQRATLTRKQQIDHVAALLDECGQSDLMNLLDKSVVQLAVPVQRAIAILREALSGAHMIMIDEPTSGLDHDQAGSLLSLMKHLSKKHSILVVLHSLSQTRDFADHVVLLASGEVVEQGSRDDFFERPATDLARQFITTGSCAEEPREPLSEESEDNSVLSRAAVEINGGGSKYGPRGFLWLLPNRLAGTPWPGIVQDERYDLESLRSVGVTQLITLTEDPFPAERAAEVGIRCFHSPMPDMEPPTLLQGQDICLTIDAMLAQGEVIAVHCRAGLGRTGTILTAYLIWRGRGELSALKALEQARRIDHRWVQSESQIVFLEEFAQAVTTNSLVA
jgi:atypical dual specificity phosphatase